MEATTKKFGLDMFQHIIIGECIDLWEMTLLQWLVLYTIDYGLCYVILIDIDSLLYKFWIVMIVISIIKLKWVTIVKKIAHYGKYWVLQW
jgi:hypothetical protein